MPRKSQTVTLVIRHQSADAEHSFKVQRTDAAGRTREAATVQVSDPLSLALAGTQQQLGAELSWYLEDYLDYPFGPNELRADRVKSALEVWGQQSFDALFGQGQARDFYHDATRDGHDHVHVVIASDDARVLSWPWEALQDPQAGTLAQLCRIERQLDELAAPAQSAELSTQRIGLLLVSARPYEGDVSYRSISRPLVELIHEDDLPVDVHLLRPPTFEQLRQELRANPGRYHIVHFDGHGGFGEDASAERFRGPQGRLIFEKEDGSEDPVTAAQLSQLLREHRIPIAVLNACQSAMLSNEVDSAFASVATALLRAGVRSVVAMGYSLYVSAAKVFLPSFYRRLFEEGSIAEATRAGRQAMFANPQRLRGFELQDWLVPVLYQNDPLPLTFQRLQHQAARSSQQPVPSEAQLTPQDAPYGLIGRDSAVLALERASRRPPAGLLLHGLGGVGKTTLARGYIDWLAKTGVSQPVVWLSFHDIRSASYVCNRLVEAVFGTDAMAAPDEQKWPTLVKALRAQRCLIVWDNFESASGIGGISQDDVMPPTDRQQLKSFLEQLRGGRSNVLITSRSDEIWLGMTACYRIALGGLQGEERQEFAQALLQDQGLKVDPKDQDLADLIDSLEGHPLMMRIILPRLGQQSAQGLRQALEHYEPDPNSVDPGERRLYATLRYTEDTLPVALRPLLYPVSLHEGYVDADVLAGMAKAVQSPLTEQQTVEMLQLLESAGLSQGLGQNIFRLHPALSRYLRSRAQVFVPDEPARQDWDRAFVQVLAQLASHYTLQPLHRQHAALGVYGASIERARGMVNKTTDFAHYGVLTQCLGAYAQNRHYLPLAEGYFTELARHCEAHGQQQGAAGTYHRLGMVAQHRGDLTAAESWYRKSLVIEERLNSETGMAGGYHQLGILAQLRGDLTAAESWYRKSLAIEERLNNELGLSGSYHHLGIVAQLRRDLTAAESWYRKSLAIEERLNNEPGMAGSYHQLGIVAQLRRDLTAAEGWYRKSLAIKERLGDEPGVASSYHQLGMVAEERLDLTAAEGWYRKSLAIKERLGEATGLASTYHQLSIVAQLRGDLTAAEAWSQKSLTIETQLGNEPGIAGSCHQLGIVAHLRGELTAAADWYQKSVMIDERLGDQPSMAMTYVQLGNLARAQRDNTAAESWYQRALDIFERIEAPVEAANTRKLLQEIREGG